MKKILISLAVVFSLLMMLVGCSSDNRSGTVIPDSELIVESVVSPNEAYVSTAEDRVLYEITVSQNNEHTILVHARANTPFFDEMQYTVPLDAPISKSDVKIAWTTLMGNPDATEEDQLGIATITILKNEKIINERKINFAKKAFEIIVDGMNQTK